MTPVLRRLVAAIMAAGFVAIGVLVIVEVVAASLGRGPLVLSPTGTWRTTMWSDPRVRWVAAIAGVVGIICVLVAGWRDAPTTVATVFDNVEVERRSLEHAVQRQVSIVDGVADVTVTARTDHTDVVVDTNRTLDTATVEEEARSCVDNATHRFGVSGPARVVFHAARARTEQP